MLAARRLAMLRRALPAVVESTHWPRSISTGIHACRKCRKPTEAVGVTNTTSDAPISLSTVEGPESRTATANHQERTMAEVNLNQLNPKSDASDS